jgi:hypothetical protein
MKLVGVKYCGGCNPVIDRAKLVQKIKKLLSQDFVFTTKQSSSWDIGILVCGCPTACADKPDFKNLARKWIIVAGNSVDLDITPEKDLADAIVSKLKPTKRI